MFACGCSLQQPESGKDPAEFAVPCDRHKPGTTCQNDRYDAACYTPWCMNMLCVGCHSNHIVLYRAQRLTLHRIIGSGYNARKYSCR